MSKGSCTTWRSSLIDSSIVTNTTIINSRCECKVSRFANVNGYCVRGYRWLTDASNTVACSCYVINWRSACCYSGSWGRCISASRHTHYCGDADS
ncbi:hypothetical protein MGSAQ_000677 [marine sediment metagenome]|uniref:Uncharacterized protein n=1 Tax=marine sediment metagenome TaxID=412755 RepID=A0A1B6NWK4_9ZZZZ